MSEITCFWLEELPRARISLRRYHAKNDGNCCPGLWGYHRARAGIETVEVKVRETLSSPKDDSVPADDPRWPVKCVDCDYMFVEADHRIVDIDQLYRRSDTGEETTISDAPVGAMWEAYWYERLAGKENSHFRVGPDGKIIVVLTPGGHWCVDQVSSQGGFWDRSGEAPNLTVTPSILIGPPGAVKYHGFLTGGVLRSTADSPT